MIHYQSTMASKRPRSFKTADKTVTKKQKTEPKEISCDCEHPYDIKDFVSGKDNENFGKKFYSCGTCGGFQWEHNLKKFDYKLSVFKKPAEKANNMTLITKMQEDIADIQSALEDIVQTLQLNVTEGHIIE